MVDTHVVRVGAEGGGVVVNPVNAVGCVMCALLQVERAFVSRVGSAMIDGDAQVG